MLGAAYDWPCTFTPEVFLFSIKHNLTLKRINQGTVVDI